MSKNLVKIKLIFVLSLFTVSCSLQKSLLDEDLILEKTNIKINGNLIKKDSLSEGFFNRFVIKINYVKIKQ